MSVCARMGVYACMCVRVYAWVCVWVHVCDPSEGQRTFASKKTIAYSLLSRHVFQCVLYGLQTKFLMSMCIMAYHIRNHLIQDGVVKG